MMFIITDHTDPLGKTHPWFAGNPVLCEAKRRKIHERIVEVEGTITEEGINNLRCVPSTIVREIPADEVREEVVRIAGGILEDPLGLPEGNTTSALRKAACFLLTRDEKREFQERARELQRQGKEGMNVAIGDYFSTASNVGRDDPHARLESQYVRFRGGHHL